MINEGDRLPPATFFTMSAEGPRPVTSDEFFARRTVVLFSAPGAFTPAGSLKQLPDFLAHAETLKAKGADEIACTAVNDVFVMDAWFRQAGADGRIAPLADAQGEFVKALGLQQIVEPYGMGERGRRFAMIAVGGVVRHLRVEPGLKDFEVSRAENILALL
ncbi:MAG TPA: peroxiredoxin [Novosphingobium sp.]